MNIQRETTMNTLYFDISSPYRRFVFIKDSKKIQNKYNITKIIYKNEFTKKLNVKMFQRIQNLYRLHYSLYIHYSACKL